MSYRLHLLTSMVALAITTCAIQGSAIAQAKGEFDGATKPKGGTITLSHTPPKPDDLPYPGQKLTLRVQLRGTKETERVLRVLYVKDGRMMDLSSTNAELNEQDIPTYRISVNAPVAEMVYQLMLYNPDGSVTASPRYSVRRNCVPNVDLAQGEVKPEIVGVERLQKLVNEAKHLEQDLGGYEQVLNLLDGLHKQIGGGEQ